MDSKVTKYLIIKTINGCTKQMPIEYDDNNLLSTLAFTVKENVDNNNTGAAMKQERHIILNERSML